MYWYDGLEGVLYGVDEPVDFDQLNFSCLSVRGLVFMELFIIAGRWQVGKIVKIIYKIYNLAGGFAGLSRKRVESLTLPS